ncbi:hypothetical protein AGABI2DRAFT_118523 [Agaricus bisporus var. bisporus H97]|uniref:hypothetical protein n=1 Tax=Agaricus bisporus var. bisporus (strain H97 / ATCC MYA-4626 / FGSC 10389) TaxID=936046 RepID=UPI00029F6BF5|nr:hypothetical protein AGABI2DRAFT_118523 [Agaricus bisporus var. bisporus H97]EKV46333.1 hypothetical protein AGABI2DRAFT_118523 [Agaricus bisporus var. bisporus H97]
MKDDSGQDICVMEPGDEVEDKILHLFPFAPGRATTIKNTPNSTADDPIAMTPSLTSLTNQKRKYASFPATSAGFRRFESRFINFPPDYRCRCFQQLKP